MSQVALRQVHNSRCRIPLPYRISVATRVVPDLWNKKLRAALTSFLDPFSMLYKSFWSVIVHVHVLQARRRLATGYGQAEKGVWRTEVT